MIFEMSFLWIIFARIRRKAHYTLLHSDQCRRHKRRTCSIGSSGICLGVWGACFGTSGNDSSETSWARRRTVGICKSVWWAWPGKGHITRRNIYFEGLDRPGIRYFIFPCIIQWEMIKEELFISTDHNPFCNRLLYLRTYWCTVSVGSIILLLSTSSGQKWHTSISRWICLGLSIQQIPKIVSMSSSVSFVSCSNFVACRTCSSCDIALGIPWLLHHSSIRVRLKSICTPLFQDRKFRLLVNYRKFC